jgi:hypothetical protein
MGNVMAFPNVVPMPLHPKNCKQLCAGETFENQMMSFGGIANLFFSVMGKKEQSNVHQTWVMAKLMSTENMCHTLILFYLL